MITWAPIPLDSREDFERAVRDATVSALDGVYDRLLENTNLDCLEVEDAIRAVRPVVEAQTRRELMKAWMDLAGTVQ